MAYLVEEQGASAGKWWPLRQDVTILGRHADCDVLIAVSSVSRHHARLLRIGGVHYVEELASRGETMLNGKVVRGRQRLTDGDRVAIGGVVFRYQQVSGGGEVIASVMDDLAPGAEIELGERVCVWNETCNDLEQACKQVRQGLTAHRLVFHPFKLKSIVQEALLEEDPIAMDILGRGFHRLVTLDVAHGVEPWGTFDLAGFYEYAFHRFEEAFNLQPAEDYHEQDLMQVLMDEEPSLVCLLNVHLAPSVERQRMRSLTQERHHALVVYGQINRSTSQEAVIVDDVRDDIDDLGSVGPCLEVTFRPDSFQIDNAVASGSPLYVMLATSVEISKCLGRSLSLDEVLPQVLSVLFKVFPQADRAFVVLRQTDGKTAPRWTKANREKHEDKIEINRTIVDQVMASREAILSVDAGSDERFETSQSVADSRICSVMCAPLIGGDGEVLGVLQVDTLDQPCCFQSTDLEVLASVAAQAAIAVENARLFERAVQQRTLERDLEFTRQVQQSILPRIRPKFPGYEFFEIYQPASQISCDFFDYVRLPDGRIAVIVADVAGHGAAAALMMAKLLAASRFFLATENDPCKVVQRLNAKLCAENTDDRFAKLVLTVLHPKSHEVTLVNAGHTAPLLCQSTGLVQEIGTAEVGLPLGITKDVVYGRVGMTLAGGQKIVVFTDGLTTATDGNGRQYGLSQVHRMASVAMSSPTQLVARTVEDFRRHVGASALQDDMCILCFGRE